MFTVFVLVTLGLMAAFGLSIYLENKLAVKLTGYGYMIWVFGGAFIFDTGVVG